MTRAVIKKNGRERVEVSISEFKGRKFLDIRNYFYDSENDEWKPTQKGVNVPVEMAHELFRAVKKVGKPFFDLLTPPDEEAESKAGKAASKKKENESGIQRKPKVDKKEVQRIRDAVEKSAKEHAKNTKKKKSKDDDSDFGKKYKEGKKLAKKIAAEMPDDAFKSKKKVSKMAKEIGKKVAKEYLEEIDAKIAGKKKKKSKDKDKKSKTKEVKVKKSKRMQLDEE